MLYEIEFMAVGEGSRAGDAIVIRYGDKVNFQLMVVDGGTAETGEKLVAHLKTHYGNIVKLDHVVLTHSDADHASGLREVLREIPVANVWLHIPWFLSAGARQLFKNKNLTDQTLAAEIKKAYDIIGEIVDLAFAAQGTAVRYPFQGEQIGPFVVLSPNAYAYTHLLPQFEKTPEPDEDGIKAANMWIGKAPGGLLKAIFEAARTKVSKWLPESWVLEHLRDGSQTSASNESSVVLYADFGDERRVLLTGDAGVEALRWSINYAVATNRVLQKFTCVQIPHHGSRRNVGPSVLNALLGPIEPEGTPSRFTAIVSAPKDDDQHPRKIVLNAFRRRGANVFATQGKNLLHYGGFPTRQGYSDAVALPFSNQVEQYE
jgi:beta-lactamase superfamily II metal-dependent hydrolase